MLDRCRPQADVVPRGRLLDADVVRHAKTLLVRLVEQRLHEIPVGPAELDPVDTHALELSDPLARLLRRTRHRRRCVARIDEDARTRDLASVAPLAQLEDLPRVRADVPDRGDPGREPELELVLERLRCTPALLLYVAVSVDQPRQEKLPRRIDLGVGGRSPRPPLANGNRIEEDDLRDAVALDYDVCRAASRGAVPVRDRDVPDGIPR